MNVEDKIEELKKVSRTNRIDEKKEIYIFEEVNFKDFEIGTIINEYDNEIFEVYMYIKGYNKSASKILLKEFNNLDSAKEYYKELLLLAKEGNLDKIIEKSKAWFFWDLFVTQLGRHLGATCYN